VLNKNNDTKEENTVVMLHFADRIPKWHNHLRTIILIVQNREDIEIITNMRRT